MSLFRTDGKPANMRNEATPLTPEMFKRGLETLFCVEQVIPQPVKICPPCSICGKAATRSMGGSGEFESFAFLCVEHSDTATITNPAVLWELGG